MKRISPIQKRLLYWSPRVLTILFVVFLSLFALDVFKEGYGFWKTVLALAIHPVPAFIVVAVLLLTWRWEWVGAVLFATAAALYTAQAFQLGRNQRYRASITGHRGIVPDQLGEAI